MYKFLFLLAFLFLMSCSDRDNGKKENPDEPVLCNFDETAFDESVFDHKIDSVKEKIVAIGDIHGDMGALIEVLYKAEIIDENLHWHAGKTILVQAGDILDRGNDEVMILSWLEKLKEEAEHAGGKIFTLTGNHEVLNVQGNFSFVSEAGFSSFIEAGTPRELAFTPGGQCARYLSRNFVILDLAGNIFVHGGVFPENVTQGIPAINKNFSKWMRGIGIEPDDSEMDVLWSREYSLYLNCELLKETLDLLNAKRMIVGHTVQDEINSACDGTLFRIDTGMLNNFGGPRQALVIENDNVSFIK